MLLVEKCKTKRNRGQITLCISLCILLGLLSRSTLPLPVFFRTYGGDTLWASMFYFIFLWLWPKQKAALIFVITVLFAFVIECSQMIDVAWLNALRQTPLRLLLGQGFLISDLLCYVVGAVLAYVLDLFICYKNNQHI